ncbi:hypothetical protein AB0B42_00500 [Streptomyces fradiae]|uniref:hypothetical protein n=1 Tax=Streptomyces fradiae TaxID=1906 RepID=UPI00340EFFFF
MTRRTEADLEVLYDEEWPTGLFGGPKPPEPYWSPEEQAAHLQALADAIRAPHPRPRPASTDTPAT